MNELKLQHVTYVPRDLAPGVLYVSLEYAVAAHLCACGCGAKVVTPLGPAEWSFTELGGRPSLCPSIGNWQLPCRSHYVISDGQIHWAKAWSDAQVIAGRNAEESRRRDYYIARERGRSIWRRAWNWILRLFGKH